MERDLQEKGLCDDRGEERLAVARELGFMDSTIERLTGELAGERRGGGRAGSVGCGVGSGAGGRDFNRRRRVVIAAPGGHRQRGEDGQSAPSNPARTLLRRSEPARYLMHPENVANFAARPQESNVPKSCGSRNRRSPGIVGAPKSWAIVRPTTNWDEPGRAGPGDCGPSTLVPDLG